MYASVLLLVASLISVAAFAPSTSRVSSSLQMSFAGGLPGADGPELKNFDPLKFTVRAPEWIPFFREAELKHCRIAMLATLGFIAAEFVKLPGDVHQVSSANAHAVSVESGALIQVLIWTSLLEIISIPAVAELSKGTRKPGDFSFDPLKLGAKPANFEKYAVSELKNGRLAMIAIGGLATQAVLSGKGFPYF